MTRYELLDRIGVGGMAEIFRGKAVAAGGFEKPVAIKRILPHLSQDRRFVELLIAEAKVLSLLKHRNIVQIFDVGLGDDGKYFLVMEFVDGKDMGAVQRALETRRRRIPFDLALHVGAEICEALEHAHTARAPDGKQMSLVHRDVSPSNVLLSRAGEVKLTDFGIAKRAEHDPTQTGAVRGKFAYISPEQARNEHLDPRSDVFSVGLLLWELVCNRRLFSGLDDMAALRGVREANVPRPTEIDGRLPPEIDQLLLGALAKDKSRRIASAGQFGAKLRALRYSLDVTVGDPATELAKIIESTEEVERESQRSMPAVRRSAFELEPSEATVIRIRTADAFSARDNDASIVAARQVIDRFEEEETRLAQLSGDQIRMLRDTDQRDSSEISAATPPRSNAERPLPGVHARAKRPSDVSEHAPTALAAAPILPTPDEPTLFLEPRDRRTPTPATTQPRGNRPATAPPPIPPSRARGPTPGPPLQSPPTTMPGTPAPVINSGLPPIYVGPPIGPPPPFAQQPPPPAPMPPQLPPNSGAPLPLSGGAALPMGAPPPAWSPPIVAQRPPREATPTAQDSFERPLYPDPRNSSPQVAGYQRAPVAPTIAPWMLVVGAVIMAGLAFLVTRMFIK